MPSRTRAQLISKTMVQQSKKEKTRKKKINDVKISSYDRFAGSSEDEDISKCDYERITDEHSPPTKFAQHLNMSKKNRESEIKTKNKEEKYDHFKEGSSEEDEYDGDMYNDNSKSNGDKGLILSDAITKILNVGTSGEQGTKKKRGIQSTEKTSGSFKKKKVVLSRTRTHLQERQEEEKSARESLLRKRKERRDLNLSALHTPSKLDWKEVENERTLRRIGTRGVVALFNAISKHQMNCVDNDKVKTAQALIGQGKVQKMTKKGFLEMLKQTASEKTNNTAISANIKEKETAATVVTSNQNEDKERIDQKTTINQKEKENQWSALRDDYMMGAKLKDWDKELSDNEDLSIEDSDNNENL